MFTMFKMNNYTIHEYVKDMKLKHKYFTNKQCRVIDNLYMYMSDANIYRIVVNINPDMLKAAKKLGFEKEHIIFDVHQKVYVEEKYNRGKFILIYDVNNGNCDVFGGEITEEEQIEKLKRGNIC